MTNDGQLTKREQLRIARAQLDELADRGDLGAQSLRQNAWHSVGLALLEARSHRTRLVASRMVLDRTDPIPSEPDPGVVNVTAVQIVLEEPSRERSIGSNGATAFPANGIEIHLDGNGTGHG